MVSHHNSRNVTKTRAAWGHHSWEVISRSCSSSLGSFCSWNCRWQLSHPTSDLLRIHTAVFRVLALRRWGLGKTGLALLSSSGPCSSPLFSSTWKGLCMQSTGHHRTPSMRVRMVVNRRDAKACLTSTPSPFVCHWPSYSCESGPWPFQHW